VRFFEGGDKCRDGGITGFFGDGLNLVGAVPQELYGLTEADFAKQPTGRAFPLFGNLPREV